MSYDPKDHPRDQLEVKATKANSCLAVVIVPIFFTLYVNFSFLINIEVSRYSV